MNAISEIEAEIKGLGQQQAAPGAQPAEPRAVLEPLADEVPAMQEAEPEPQTAEPGTPDPARDEAKNVARRSEEERRGRRDAQKALQERQTEYDRNLAVLNDRLERLQQAAQAPAPPPEPQKDLPEHVKLGKQATVLCGRRTARGTP